MRPYEVMLIFDASLEEEIIRARSTVTATSSALAVAPRAGRRWGKRRLAYEIRHRWEGYYVLLAATASPG